MEPINNKQDGQFQEILTNHYNRKNKYFGGDEDKYMDELIGRVEKIKASNELRGELFDDFYKNLVTTDEGLFCVEGSVDVSLIVPNDPCGELPWTIADQLEELGMKSKNGPQALDGQSILVEMTKTCTKEAPLFVQASEFFHHCGVIEYALILKNGNYGVDVKYTPKEIIENNN